MPPNSSKLYGSPVSVVDLTCSASTESEESEQALPLNYEAVIAQIQENPSTMSSIKVSGVRKLNGLYKCMGVINHRPYYKNRNVVI